jgi:hypothetical protein
LAGAASTEPTRGRASRREEKRMVSELDVECREGVGSCGKWERGLKSVWK